MQVQGLSHTESDLLYSILPNYGSVRHTLFAAYEIIISFFLLLPFWIYESVCVYFPDNPSSYGFSNFPRTFLCTLSKDSAATSTLLDVFDFFFASFATAEQNTNN